MNVKKVLSSITSSFQNAYFLLQLKQCNILKDKYIFQWATICLKLPFSTLKTVCTGLVNEMKRLSMNNPGLSVASSIGDRLNYLLPNNGEGWSNTVERSMMYSEVARQKTFRTWPHMNYK